MKERIFISYKRDDKDVVFKLKDDIEKNVGVKCWVDLDAIESNAQFVNVIIKAIDAADIFLFMYSKKHAEITDFENDWTIKEINYAQTKKKRIIFLNLDGTPLSNWFLLMFGLQKQVDVFSTVAMNRLYVDLTNWLKVERPRKSVEELEFKELSDDGVVNTKVVEGEENFDIVGIKNKQFKYDVFISSKSEDYCFAEKIYDFLLVNGYSVFLACKELEKLGEAQYADAIDNAIDCTCHMIVVSSSLEHINSKWVKYEWSTFSSDLKSGYRTGNLLTILDSIDLSFLPASLRHQQSFTFKEWQNSILGYLSKQSENPSNEKIVYKVRVNRTCWLYIDGERIQQLKANEMAKIQLKGGEYLRKVVDCEEVEVFKEDKIQLQEKSVVDDIDLAALYQKYLRRRDSNGIWETCKLFFRQRLGWVISFCLVCAVAVGVFFWYENNEEFIIIVDGHECVDLGLSVKWATCNVGAKTPEEYGDYFAWGETEPKTTYNWSTYKYCVDDSVNLTKYCSLSSYGNNGFTDSKTVLDPEDDAAAVNWGGAWRMPTKEEQDELREKCTWTGTTQNGVYGCKVTGPNGKSIFLPAAGYMDEGNLYDDGSWGDYWSSSLRTDLPNDAYYLSFYSGGMYVSYCYHYYGCSVRPVCQ